jgi:hypothetical protein
LKKGFRPALKRRVTIIIKRASFYVLSGTAILEMEGSTEFHWFRD